MKILAPTNKKEEVEELIKAGADELYCGVLERRWNQKYTNIASPNRREWTSANLASYDELKAVVDIAHSYSIPVYLTLNALYTQKQYPLIYQQIEQSRKIGVDALILADLGLLLSLKKENIDSEIHISTGGTTFNSQTAKFYEELGATRIILPRHLQVQEIEEIVRDCPGLKFEVFILNSGCKNIDGFCTFHHGVNEVLHPYLWNLPKRLNLDRYFLNIIRRLPKKTAQKIRGNIFGIDSACLLNYTTSFLSNSASLDKKRQHSILENVSSGFSFLSGVDTCGACRLAEFVQMGVYGVKIVGRNYSTAKKVKDVTFLKTALSLMNNRSFSSDGFRTFVKNEFKRIYSMDCCDLCYYPIDV